MTTSLLKYYKRKRSLILAQYEYLKDVKSKTTTPASL